MTDITREINQVTDPQTRKALQALFDALNTDVSAIVTAFNAHTHNGDGAQAGSYFTSPPRSDAATVTAGTASTVTQTLTD